jgi:hypothetical protein
MQRCISLSTKLACMAGEFWLRIFRDVSTLRNGKFRFSLELTTQDYNSKLPIRPAGPARLRACGSDRAAWPCPLRSCRA